MGRLAKIKPCPNCESRTWDNLRGADTPSGWVCNEPRCGDFSIRGVGDVSEWKRSLRMDGERRQYAHDTAPPHVYDKLTRKLKPNPDFIKHFGDNAREWYRPSELKEAGYGKLAETVQEKRDADGVPRDLGGAL